MSCRTALLAGALVFPTIAAAQHDYRNLDHGRPMVTEDAYPVERGAFEVTVPLGQESRHRERTVTVSPEVMWGVVRNGMLGLGAPLVLGQDGGLAGLHPFAFYNLNTETAWPALAFRLDGALPVGGLVGERGSATVTAIATRSFGTTRLHLNGGVRLTSAHGGAEAHTPPRHTISLAVDRTLWRQSVLVVAELRRVGVARGVTAWEGGLGVRMQGTPVMVLDAGVRTGGPAGSRFLTTAVGLTRFFSLNGGIE